MFDHDPNEDPMAMGSLSMAGLAVFILLSVCIAAGGYYGVHYVFSGLPNIVTHNAPR